MKFKVKIKGIAPLLQHRFSEEKLTSVSKRKGDRKLSDEEKKDAASEYLYVDGKGRVSQPSSHIEGAMIKAATEIKLAGAGKKTYKDLVKATCFVFPEFIPHIIQDWEVDSRSTVNPSTGGRNMCYRPRLENWELAFDLEVNDDRADEHAIKQILEIAGLQRGIGSYRPRFGRFEVVEFNKTK